MVTRHIVPLIQLALTVAFAVGCQTTDKATAESYPALYSDARFAEAERELDKAIAAEAAVGSEVVTRTKATGPEIDVTRGNTCLLLLDKGMLRLAEDDAATSVALWRRSRDELDRHMVESMSDEIVRLLKALPDDSSLPYAGADYELVAIRAMLALADLLGERSDAFAYAEQVGEKQEQIIGSSFGSVWSELEYKPRANYRRVGLGAYLQGLIRESRLTLDEAAKAYQRALDYSSGSCQLYTGSLERVKSGVYTAPNQGALHVFYLAGRGPVLEQTTSVPTEAALRLAGLLLTVVQKDPSLLIQAPVPIPAVRVQDSACEPLTIEAADRRMLSEVVLDINQVAQGQLEANITWLLARAAVRRALVSQASKATNDLAGSTVPVGSLGGTVLTATEKADTRIWRSLPAQVQAARLELPAGEHNVRLAASWEQPVRITAGRDTYLIVVRPDLKQRGVAIVDVDSRVAPAPAAAEKP